MLLNKTSSSHLKGAFNYIINMTAHLMRYVEPRNIKINFTIYVIYYYNIPRTKEGAIYNVK